MLANSPDLTALSRVLVIKLRHHGDVLLTSPVFSVLKRHAPQLKIDALVYRDTADMLTFHPDIEEVLTIDRNWKKLGVARQVKAEWALLSRLRGKHYDLVIHLSPHPRGAWIRRLTGARYGVAPARKQPSRWWNGSFTHQFAWAPGNTRHTVETHLDALRCLGLQPQPGETRLVLEPGIEARQSVAALLTQHGLQPRQFIHVHPTSRWLFKCWPAEKMAALIRQMQAEGHTIVVTAAPDARELAMRDRILADLTQPVVDLSGQLSLKQLAALTAQARLFIGVDSAPMHIAAAMQTPTVALFGPSGDIEWGPWQVPSRVVTMDLPCRPCGQDGCGGSKISDCLVNLPLETVYGAVTDLLATP